MTPLCEKCNSTNTHQTVLPKGRGSVLVCMDCKHVKTHTPLPPADSVRNDAGYKRWKKAVQTRDGFKCQLNGCGRKERLETHHIRRWTDDLRLRYDPRNGVTLCYDCHHSIQDKEDDYIAYFDEVVKQNAAQDPRAKLLMLKLKKDHGQSQEEVHGTP